MFDREKSYLSVFNIVPFTMLLSLPGWFFLFVYLNKIGIFPYFLKNINIPSIVFISISIIAIYAILFLFSFFSSMCFFVFLHPIFSGKQIILHFYFFRIPIQNIRTKWDVWKTEKIIKKCLNRSFLIICHIIFFIYFLYMIFLTCTYYRLTLDKNILYLLLYFNAFGFLTSLIFYFLSLNEEKKNLQEKKIFLIFILLMGVMLLVVFKDSVFTMTRTVNSIFNFHTPNNKKVFILKNKILEVDNLLELYGEKSKKDCYLTNNKDYVSLSIEGRDLPLVIIWNDASDKVVVGFDGSIKKNEDLYLPPVFINSDFIKELSPKSLNLTCNKK